MNLDLEKVKAWQRTLSSAGFYHGIIDGDFGPMTEAATVAWKKDQLVADVPPVAVKPPAGTTVDARSETIIATLHPMVQQPFRDLLNTINAQVAPQFGVTGRWISGTRNEQEQNAEVAAGFSHAHWPYSAHNGGGGKEGGFACDLGWFDSNGRYVEKESATALAVKIDREMGFHPGADFGDSDHHCKRPPSMDTMTETGFINEMIRRVKEGIPLWP